MLAGSSLSLSSNNSSIKSEACLVKKRLTNELLNAHSQLAELNNRAVQCILCADWAGSAALADQFNRARARRERALEAFHLHVAEHGCRGA
jgi:hypothetical protein